MNEKEIQVTVPYEQFEKMKKQLDENSIRVETILYDGYPPVQHYVEYKGKDEAINTLIAKYTIEINTLKEEVDKLQKKLNKKHFWNKKE